MVERCLKRAETSGRSDDNPETIIKRIDNYFNESLPVVDYYKQFGKVRHINALGSIPEVYAQSKACALPQCMFMLGPKSSGKTTVSNKMAKRTNMTHIDFCDYLEKNGLEGQDDETVTQHFINFLSAQQCPRMVIESFPQNTL
jgi:adenylate kinase family enzyme